MMIGMQETDLQALFLQTSMNGLEYKPNDLLICFC